MLLSLSMWIFIWLWILITYAANITSISWTYNSWDTLGIEWFNDIKARLSNIYGSWANVGIGTATPTTKLDVNWIVKATSFQWDWSQLTWVIPTWAVMAFNLTNCPTWWSILDSAKWKTIVWLSTESEFNSLLKTWWEKTHNLTINEIPSHNHTGKTGIWVDFSWTNAYRDYNTSGTNIRYLYASDQLNVWNQLQDHKHTIPSEGGNSAHNNLQPYITLLYCQKN